MSRTGIIVLLVVFLGAVCTARNRDCRPGIWCYNDEINAKLAGREETARNRELKVGYRRINGAKKSDALNNEDIEREFEGYFGNY